MKKYFYPIYNDGGDLIGFTNEYETDGAYGDFVEIDVPDYLFNKREYFLHMHPEYKK